MNPETAHAAPGEDRGRVRGRRHLLDADGRRGRAAPQVHRGERAQRAQPRHLTRDEHGRQVAARSPSTSKTRCASPTWTTRCRSSSARALPDARDGLKPVHRRILYAMFSEGLLHNRRYSKCAGVVGEVLKRYHPHGDSAVYDALVRLAQEWNLRYPLIDGQGNFGSVDGDPAGGLPLHRVPPDGARRGAARRHRQGDRRVRPELRRLDARSRSSSRARCRTCWSTASSGIAVGMATNIPPHNLGEVCDAPDRADRERPSSRSTS